jgi:ABC-type multidrug transport system ATPase subunit
MIIDVDHLSKRYGRVIVINDLCLEVPEASAFALLGTNGAGKTTALRLLVNIIKPDTGNARARTHVLVCAKQDSRCAITAHATDPDSLSCAAGADIA